MVPPFERSRSVTLGGGVTIVEGAGQAQHLVRRIII
jgi:hypothetical protein